MMSTHQSAATVAASMYPLNVCKVSAIGIVAHAYRKHRRHIDVRRAVKWWFCAHLESESDVRRDLVDATTIVVESYRIAIRITT